MRCGCRSFTIACPAFPDNERTVFKGHLFVGDVLLSDERHAQPSADADDRRQPGARAAGADAQRKVGPASAHDVVAQARDAAIARAHRRSCAARASRSRSSMRSPTTTCMRLGAALQDLPLVTAGSGVAIGPAAELAGSGAPAASADAHRCRRSSGCARSCRAAARLATNAQVRHFRERGRRGARDRPAGAGRRRRRGRPQALALGRRAAGATAPVLVYATAEPGAVQRGAGRARRRRAPASWSSARSRASRAAWSSAACAAWSSPAARPRARWCRRWACGSCASARRSIPACRGRRARRRRCGDWLHLALKSGNFGARRLLRQGLRAVRRMNADDAARTRSAASAARCTRAATCTRRAGNISVRADERLSDHADRRLPRHARARRGWPRSTPQGAAGGRRSRASKTLALHRRIYAADADARLRDPHPLARTCVALTPAGVWTRDDIVPPITPYFVMKVGHVPLIAYHRPGDPAVAERGGRSASPRARAARRADPRAVMLERLGPNVWHRHAGRSDGACSKSSKRPRALWLHDAAPAAADRRADRRAARALRRALVASQSETHACRALPPT